MLSSEREKQFRSLLLTFPLFELIQVCELQVLVIPWSAGVSLGRVSVTNSRSFIPPAMFDLRPFRFRVDGRGGAGKPHPSPSLHLTISQEVRYKGLPVKYWAQDLQNHTSSLQAMLFVLWLTFLHFTEPCSWLIIAMIMFLFYIFDGTSNVACKRLLEFSGKFSYSEVCFWFSLC